MFKRSAALTIMGAFTLSGCLEARLVSKHATATPADPITQNFVASDKVDLLVAVNGSSMTTDQQQQIQASIDTIMSLLAASGYDYHVGLVSTSPLQTNGGGLGGLIGSLFGQQQPTTADWVSSGLGILQALNGSDRFLTPGSSVDAQQELLDLLTASLANGASANSKNQYSQILSTLLPVIIKASDMGANKASYDDILKQVTPLVLAAVNNGSAGGNYADIMNVVLPIVQQASNGGAQGTDFNTLVATLLPVAIDAAVAGYGGGGYAQVASVVIPVVLKLADKGSKGASFGDLMTSIVPLVMAEVSSNPNTKDYAQLISIVTPLVLKAASGNGGQPLNFNDLLADLLPIGLNAITSNSGGGNYGAVVAAVMPVVLNALSDPSVRQDPEKLVATLTDVGLLSVVKAIDPKLGTNAGFMRDDAILSVVMIGEKALSGEKIDTAELAKTFVDVLGESKGGNADLLRFAAILATSPDKCAALAQVEDTYSEIAKYTGGAIGDLCKDPSQISNVIAQQIVRNLTGVTLNQSPVVASIMVLVNGLVVPQGEANGWSLSPDGKTINFHGSYIPNGLSKIQVSYVPEMQAQGADAR
jgi:hypothetical protein